MPTRNILKLFCVALSQMMNGVQSSSTSIVHMASPMNSLSPGIIGVPQISSPVQLATPFGSGGYNLAFNTSMNTWNSNVSPYQMHYQHATLQVQRSRTDMAGTVGGSPFLATSLPSSQSVAEQTVAGSPDHPPPPPLDSINGNTSLEGNMQAAEMFYWRYYRDSVLKSGCSMEDANAQAKEAIAKLHEIGYFSTLRDVYMQRLALNEQVRQTSVLPQGSSVTLQQIQANALANAAATTARVPEVLSHASSLPNVTQVVVPVAQPRQAGLFQLKLHSNFVQPFSSSVSRFSSQAQRSIPDFASKRSRFDVKDELFNRSSESPQAKLELEQKVKDRISAIMTKRTVNQSCTSEAVSKRHSDEVSDSLSMVTSSGDERSPDQTTTTFLKRRYPLSKNRRRYSNNSDDGKSSDSAGVSRRNKAARVDVRQSFYSLSGNETNTVHNGQSVFMQDGCLVGNKWKSPQFRNERGGEQIDVDVHDSNEIDPHSGQCFPYSLKDVQQEENEAYPSFIPLSGHQPRRGRGRGKTGKAQRGWYKHGGSEICPLGYDEQSKRLQRMERFTGAVKQAGFEDDAGGVFGGFTSSGDFIICRDGQSTHSTGAPLLSWQEKLELAKSTVKLVGLSTAIEKPFLRLCGPPDPHTIRSEGVLRESFKLVMEKWNSERNWRYCEEQFRSIRQDLMVQGIQNEFTLEVYESNGRIAMQNHDLGQFNQCQAQLPHLYRILCVPLEGSNKNEFLCYRLLYLALQNMRYDLLRVVGELSPAEKMCTSIQYAMKIRVALAEGNYHRYFMLYEEAPFYGRHLLDMFRDKLRMHYLIYMASASLKLSVEVLKNELKFHSERVCVDFLSSEKCIWAEPGKIVDSKLSLAVFSSSPLLKSRKVKALG